MSERKNVCPKCLHSKQMWTEQVKVSEELQAEIYGLREENDELREEIRKMIKSTTEADDESNGPVTEPESELVRTGPPTGPTPATGVLGIGGEIISQREATLNMALMNYYRVTAQFNHTDQTYWVMTMNPMFGPIPPDMAIQLAAWLVKVASENGAMLEFDEVWELINNRDSKNVRKE